jgi:hypothetical protein
MGTCAEIPDLFRVLNMIGYLTSERSERVRYIVQHEK